MKTFKEFSDMKRKQNNDEIVEKMKNGESLCKINLMECMYPRRPPIKKDKEQIKKLYKLEEG
jgi:hypothetical protein